MKKNIKFSFNVAFLAIIFLFGFKSNSFAYIDPGTGSFILQAIMAILASIAFYLGYPIRFIKNLIKKIKKEKKK
tara:strand:- start:133 stop:354 length:222 start_codon:yes stop_codon:yes gene_type:complete